MPEQTKVVKIGWVNLFGQTSLSGPKQLEVEAFIVKNDLSILMLQESNLSDDSFASCHTIKEHFSTLKNNASSGFGTAMLYRNDIVPENIRMDDNGQVIVCSVGDLTLGNIYLPSGNDGKKKMRKLRDHYCHAVLPQLFAAHKTKAGICGGDWNCVVKRDQCSSN